MFDIIINLNYWYKLLAIDNPLLIMWQLIKDGGWVVFVLVIFYGLRLWWLGWRRRLYVKNQWRFTLLAINIPRDNIQSPKAVEYIFSQLAGAYSSPNFIEKWWKGQIQESFSLEIVSDGGYLQFYIWTIDKFRDLVEAAFYAQYPDAIITEVEDYTKNFQKLRFPNNEYEMWGTEMAFVKNDAYPIRTYPMFEHALSQELKDPMAGLLEMLSHMKQGEKMWMQLVIVPQNIIWSKKFEGVVKKIIGQIGDGDLLIDKIANLPLKIIKFVNEAIFPVPTQENGDVDDQFLLMKLTPGETDVLKAVQGKLSKIAFKTSFRIIYLSRPELFNYQRGVSGLIGALQQFNTLNLNALLPFNKQTTKADYFMVKTREARKKNLLLKKYINRSDDGHKIMLNIEELATLFHFPIETVKVPLFAKIESKRGEPPVELPIEMSSTSKILLPAEEEDNEENNEKDGDDFLSLLEEAAVKRDGGKSGVKESIPEDLLENGIRTEKNVEKPIINKQKTENNNKSGVVIQDKNNTPANLPIVG